MASLEHCLRLYGGLFTPEEKKALRAESRGLATKQKIPFKQAMIQVAGVRRDEAREEYGKIEEIIKKHVGVAGGEAKPGDWQVVKGGKGVEVMAREGEKVEEPVAEVSVKTPSPKDVAEFMPEVVKKPEPEVAATDIDDNELVDMDDAPVEVNSDGTITLYHRTTAEKAESLRKTGRFKSLENTNETFFSNKLEGQAVGYGDAVITVKVKPEKVRLDDAFHDGEITVAVSNKALSKANIIEKAKSEVAAKVEKEPLSETKSRLLANIKSEKGSSELINDLSRLGADAIKRGHKSFKAFSVEMKAILGNAWTKVKHLMRRAYADAKLMLANERGLIGGVKAKGAPTGQLARAQEMLAGGKDKNEVWRETGWMKGVEKGNVWKFEIDDSGAKIKSIEIKRDKWGILSKEWVLEDILEHDQLFDAYPQLRNTKVKETPGHQRQGFDLGQYDSSSNTIFLTAPTKRSTETPYAETFDKKTLPTVLHETQHAIQAMENFALGGSPEGPLSNAERKRLIDEKMKWIRPVDEKKGISWSESFDKAGKLVDSPSERHKIYERLAGEVEARDTSARAKLTAKERKEQMPYESQGIPQDQWIVTDGKGTSFSVGVPSEGKKEHPTLTPGAQKLLGELEELKKEQKSSPPLPPEEAGIPAGKGTKVYNDLAARLRTRTVDRLYPLMYKLDKGLDITDPDAQAYIQGRMDTSAPTVVATFLQHGKLKWLENAPLVETKDEGFLPLTEKHGTNEKKVDSYDANTQTLLKDKIGYKPKSIRDIDRYLFWKIATRAEKLTGENREHLFTKDDIALLKEIGAKDWKNTDLNKEYVAFNKNVLDFAQEIGLIDPAMRKVWEHDEYIPFYRILEDELLGEEFLRAPSKSRKFIDSQIKKLVGGTDKLGDPFENILRNWSHLITESIRNRSRTTAFKYMQKLGYATPSKPPKYIGKPEKEAILSYMEKGKRKNFKVHDLELFNALSGANVQRFDGILMKMFGTSKRMLTYGATFGPAFRVANFMRDTLQTAMVNKSFIPVWDSMRGLYKAYTESPDAIAMMSGGGGFSLGYVRGDDPKAMARHVRKIVRKAHKKGFTLSPLSLLEWWEKIGSASENAARVQLYANWRKKGASHLVAGFKARDVLDFSLSGDAQITQLMVRTMPFLGARMQGLYKMGRAYGENPGAFLLKGAILAGLSLAWWSGVKDDDRYKELEDWEKWTYRHFWIGDTHYRLPRAFEVDAIFSSSVESIADTLSGNEEGKHIMHFIGQTMRDTLALDVPQLVRPLYEQAKNEIGFTGRPIISESMERVKPGEQTQPWTSESLQVLGEKLNVSPMRAEALVRGYLATIGMFILGGTDILTQWAFDFPTPPKKRVDDYPLIGRFVRETPPRHTKYMTRFYKMTREMDVLVGTINHYKKTGDIEKAVELARANRETLQYKKGVNKVRRRIGLINGRIKMIHYRKDLTPEQKKEKINKLLDYRNKILENVHKVMTTKKEIAGGVSP